MATTHRGLMILGVFFDILIANLLIYYMLYLNYYRGFHSTVSQLLSLRAYSLQILNTIISFQYY